MPDGVVSMPDALADQVEDAIYAEFKNTNSQYKTRIRSRVYNLKDIKNSELRLNVLTGAISAKKLSCMTSEVSNAYCEFSVLDRRHKNERMRRRTSSSRPHILIIMKLLRSNGVSLVIHHQYTNVLLVKIINSIS